MDKALKFHTCHLHIQRDGKGDEGTDLGSLKKALIASPKYRKHVDLWCEHGRESLAFGNLR